MDMFEAALQNLGLQTENVTDTSSKIEDSLDSDDMSINVNKPKVKEQQKLYALTNSDRDQAVKEKIVPPSYKNAIFDIEQIKSNIKAQYQKSGKIYKVYRFKDYETICTKILSDIRTGILPDQSYIIGAPNGFGKTSFVSECLMTLRAKNFRTVPYISLWELAQLRVDNEHRIMNPYRKFIKEDENVVYYDRNDNDAWLKKPQVITNGYSFSEYINADCLFVSFTDIISKDIESHTLYQILAIRGAKGLPTIATISTSLDPYENDRALKEYVWDEIKNYDENKKCYDRVYHVSCYKRKELGLNSKDIDVDKSTGIVN